MVKRALQILFIIGICIFMLKETFAEVEWSRLGPSHIRVVGTQLIVEKRLADGRLSEPQTYIIKGVTWSAATRAPRRGRNPLDPQGRNPKIPDTVDYGFFFDWSGRRPHGHDILKFWQKSEFQRHYQTDAILMEQMNVNTVRVYTDFGGSYNLILDKLYRRGIMVIMTVAISKEDLDNRRYLNIVRAYKDHPAILMWSLGNEWNLDYNKYYGYNTVAEAASNTERVAQNIKAIDTNHPVSSCIGDRFDDPVYSNTIAAIVNACQGVDVWGINVYRGETFGDLFSRWNAITNKPFYLSEFGTDSFRTTSYTLINGYQADNCTGREDQALQARFIFRLWCQIINRLSALHYQELCLGGLVHEFNDELWKVGSYHVGLGGLVDYNNDTSYDEYNTEGFYILGGHPDDVANEEYFGVVDAQRRPKRVFWLLRFCYGLI